MGRFFRILTREIKNKSLQRGRREEEEFTTEGNSEYHGGHGGELGCGD